MLTLIRLPAQGGRGTVFKNEIAMQQALQEISDDH